MIWRSLRLVTNLWWSRYQYMRKKYKLWSLLLLVITQVLIIIIILILYLSLLYILDNDMIQIKESLYVWEEEKKLAVEQLQ